MANVMEGFGALNQEMPMNSMYAGANLVQQYAIPSFQKGKEMAQNIVKEGAIKDLYAKSKESGVQPKEEDLLNIYAAVGDESGMQRIQQRIDEREGNYQKAQDAIFLAQIENAQKNNQFDLIPKILDARNADSRLVNRTGAYQYDQNLGTFDRPIQAGESIILPDGSVVTGDKIGGITAKFGKDKSGKWTALAVDTKQRDEMIKAEKSGGLSAASGLNANMQLIKQYENDTLVKDSKEIVGELANMEGSYNQFKINPKNSFALSQAVISSFNKILDPTSVVREAEYNRTPEDMAIGQRAKAFSNQISKGGKLTPEQLESLMQTARDMAAIKQKYANKKAEIYSNYGTRAGLSNAVQYISEASVLGAGQYKEQSNVEEKTISSLEAKLKRKLNPLELEDAKKKGYQ